tara:strand:- start:445 stop:672 length:228 start_codon:yes stop_codon:yes gene_type:complete
MKYFNIILLLIIFQSCSFNYDSKYWNEHNEKKLEDQKKIFEIIKKSNDITLMTMTEYKIYIDDYTKKSKYPDISK